MFRTKAAVILLGILLCATLCVGAGASQTDLLVIPEADSNAVHYTVAEVRRGTFEKTVSAQAKVVYPIRCNVYFEEAEEGGLRFDGRKRTGKEKGAGTKN